MTVVVAFVGADCAVMASDTEGTEGLAGDNRIDVEDKIWVTGGLLVGFSGSVATRDLLAAAIEAKLKAHFDGATEIPRGKARTLLAQAVGPVLKQVYGEVVTAPGQLPQHVAGGSLLVIGRDQNGHWLQEVDPSCVITSYDSQGFQAIGSGGPSAYMAHRLLRRYGASGRSLRELRLIAYRTVQSCIEVVGGRLGVGGKTRLWSCTEDGYEQASDAEIAVVENGLEKWVTIERESLDQVAGEAPDEVPAVEAAGMPEPIEHEPEPTRPNDAR